MGIEQISILDGIGNHGLVPAVERIVNLPLLYTLNVDDKYEYLLTRMLPTGQAFVDVYTSARSLIHAQQNDAIAGSAMAGCTSDIVEYLKYIFDAVDFIRFDGKELWLTKKDICLLEEYNNG